MNDEHATPTEGMIEAGAKAIHDNPLAPAMSAIDWLETPEHIRKQLRHMALVSYLAMEAWRVGNPDTQRLLERARDIDPEAWASPLHDHLAKRRSESMKRAYAELKA